MLIYQVAFTSRQNDHLVLLFLPRELVVQYLVSYHQWHKHAYLSYYCSVEMEFNQQSSLSTNFSGGNEISLNQDASLFSSPNEANSSNVQNVSFTELMETPKIKKKQVCRKKSLNYKAQLVTKKLFYGSKKTTSSRDNLSKNIPSKKSKTKPKKKNSKPLAINNVSWFCAVCGKDTALSMRQCNMCKIWYHEECVGLDSDDEDNFFCMECY